MLLAVTLTGTCSPRTTETDGAAEPATSMVNSVRLGHSAEPNGFRKRCARTGMSLDRSRSDGRRIEKFTGKAENEKLALQVTYLDYNQTPAEDLFTLNPPPGAMVIDQTTQEIGLPKGDLTDEQIAMKVAREFFEAVIAGDYAKAGRLFEGIPAEKLKEAFSGEGKVLRVVSVGTPTPHPNYRATLKVPCQIEMEINGHREIKTLTPNIRPVYGQPDRWDIIGGI